MATTWRCRVGWHQWFKRVNDSGEAYLVCVRCGKQDDNEPVAAPMDWH